MTSRAGILLGLLFALGVPNALIVQKERALRTGTVMAIALAPVDPRSLMAGDYMDLRYGLFSWDTEPAGLRPNGFSPGWPKDGHLVVRVDGHQVASFVRWHKPGSALAAGEHLLQYRVRHGQVHVGSNAFYFQEGRAEHFAAARYGVLRVAKDGSAILVGLRDKNGRSL